MLFGEFKQVPSRHQATWARLVAACLIAAYLTGCASPARLFDRRAQAAGLERFEVAGLGFDHVAYRARSADTTPDRADLLIVFLDGDGSPGKRGGGEPSIDPTPRDPLALALLMRTPVPAVYLARPCYNGMIDRANCNDSLWTSARFSPAIVASMAAATRHLAESRGNPSIVLVGYSGGGALAMLMAPHLQRLKGVVTIAANLDTDAWTRARGHAPLTDSLNPADLDGPAASVIHLIGERDTIVPPAILGDYFERRPREQVWRFAAFDHRCCWVEQWPTLLAQALHRIDTATRATSPSRPADTSSGTR